MKDFFIQCLKDLEPLTGIRQLYFMQSDLEDGERKKNVLIYGMIAAAEDYPYIPEESKKKIIRDQMVKDQNYEALNGRTIHKWLNAAANAYRTHSQFTEADLLPRDKDGKPTEVAPPEVAEKYQKELMANLAQIGTGLPKVEQILEGFKEVRRVETGRQKFIIENIEIWAMNQEEAQKAYDATFK